MRPTVYINTKFLKENLFQIRKRVGGVKIMAMVKANAYGHGIFKTIEAFEDTDYAPDYYGVAFLREALKIQNLTDKFILVTEPLSEEDIKIYFKKAKNNVLPTLSSKDNFSLWRNLITKPIRIHININSGMNRLGIREEEAVEFISRVIKDNNFIIDGIYTHFATADAKDKSFTRKQISVFKKIISNFDRKKLGLIHAANSAGIINFPEVYFDMVRPGLLLYGYSPSGEKFNLIKIKPVMSLETYLSEISYVKTGETVGYGARYKADKQHPTASIVMGYADGIDRGLSGKIKVLINGNYYKQIGTISMDRMSIKLKDENISVGEKVILIGQDGDKRISFKEWAKVLNTIPYELMCKMGGRFSRKYI